jgi:large subunit ribosomal protein L7e
LYRSVPTQNDIAVPETLQKKAKAQEKQTQARAAALKEKREVR